MKNPYGLKDGHPVLAKDVERGLACGCFCPCCNHRLEAHQGEIKAPYFAHDDGADCSQAYQSALHILAKQVLLEHKRLVLPALFVYPSEELGDELLRRKVWHRVVNTGMSVTAQEVQLERKVGDVIPDVIFRVSGKILLVEIWVTHRVDAEKNSKIEAKGLPTIEFDFSAMDRVVTKDDLYKCLVLGNRSPGRGEGQWIFHPKQKAVQEEVDQEFLGKKDQLQRELDEWRQRRAEKLRQEHQRQMEEKRRKEREELGQRVQEYARIAEEKRKKEEEEQGKDSLF